MVWSDALLFAPSANRGSSLGVAVVEDTAVVFVAAGFLLYLARSHVNQMTMVDLQRELASRALHTYVDSSPLAITSMDLMGSVVTWNPQAQRIFGWGEDEVSGKPDPSIPGESASDFQAKLQRVFRGERIENVEQVHRGKDGASVDILMSMIPIRDSNGDICGAFNVMEDISERKLERAALIDTSRSFRSAFEDAAIGMAMTGLDGHWLKVNRALCDILGYTEKELLSMTFQDVTHPDDLPTTLEYAHDMIEGKIASYQIEKRYIRKDGKVIWIALSVSLVHDSQGKPLYSIEQLQDVTDRKAAEDELKRYSVGLERMVKDRTAELEQAHALLVQTERLAAIGSVAAQVAHDLRNPLTAINTNLYYLKNVIPQRLGLKVDGSIKAMEGAVEHSSKIIDDLLEYSRATELKEENLDLSALLKKSLDSCAFPLAVKVETQLSDGVVIVADAPKLKRVFMNVISNAVEAMPEGGFLTVACREEGDKAITEITDTGIGMDEKTRKQLFNPFFTTKSRGLGLGLAICRRLVEAHGGEIHLQSDVGKGTKVTITLPKAPPEASTKAASPQPA